jgi:pilus assembly protein Flp/PilA
MKYLANQLRLFLQREEGPTAVEYAVLLALFILVCLAGLRTAGLASSKTTHTTVTATAR